jgi:SAM-dependent methyltransferase
MTTFAKTTFNATSYATFRPSYPPQLYSLLLSYHRGARKTCLDLGCGHGLIARALAPSFDQIIATDPSANMVAQATSQTSDSFPNVSFRQASAEVGIEPFSDTVKQVDMVVSGQAAHWFDFAKVWPQLSKAIRPGGTLAVWCYKDHVFVDYPKASKVFLEWIYGPSRDRLGPYWEPGRQLVRDNYAAIKPPTDIFEDQERVVYEPGTAGPGSGTGDVLMQKKMTIRDSMEYMRTWSSVHAWQEANGKPKARKDGGHEGDIVDRMYDAMRAAEGWDNDDLEVVIEWGSCVILARRK